MGNWKLQFCPQTEAELSWGTEVIATIAARKVNSSQNSVAFLIEPRGERFSFRRQKKKAVGVKRLLGGKKLEKDC